MFLAVVAHEELLDFKAARVPPGDADQEGYVPVPPERPVVSVSRKSQFCGSARIFWRVGREQTECR